MEIEAICEDGVIRFPKNLRFNHDRFTVTVTVPDRELMPNTFPPTAMTPERKEYRQGTRERLNAILGPYRSKQKRDAFTVKDYRAAWHEHLEEKHLGR